MQETLIIKIDITTNIYYKLYSNKRVASSQLGKGDFINTKDYILNSHWTRDDFTSWIFSNTFLCVGYWFLIHDNAEIYVQLESQGEHFGCREDLLRKNYFGRKTCCK